MKSGLLVLAVAAVLAGCATTGPQYLTGPGSDRPDPRGETVLGLDYRDFEYAAEQAVDSFLSSPLSRKPGSTAPWVMAISRMINDTALNIDTDQLIKKIRVDLLDSGRVMVTTAACFIKHPMNLLLTRAGSLLRVARRRPFGSIEP